MTGEKLRALICEIAKINELHVAFVENSADNLSGQEMEAADKYIRYACKEGMNIAGLARCYDLIVNDILKEQVYFKRHNKYRYSMFAEVASEVYFNKEYMKMYMYGLGLTSFLWPNHSKIINWFIQEIPKGKEGRYLEIGPGHGLYFMRSMKRTSYSFFEGVDVSPASVELTNSILSSNIFGVFDNYKVYQGDFLKMSFDDKFDAIVMGEVLEHVERPGDFLRKIRGLAAEKAFIFVTTCINSPMVDHIYLYDSVQALEEQVRSAGLSVKEKTVLPYTGLTLEESIARKVTINIALTLEK